jgi:hypothetical protein
MKSTIFYRALELSAIFQLRGRHLAAIAPGVCAVALSALLLLGAFPAIPAVLAQAAPVTNHVRIIVVASEPEARQLLKRLQAGEDFADLAKAKSIHPTADQGGDMGPVDPAALNANLRTVLAKLKPGQISGVVKIPTGFAILKLSPEEGAPSVSPVTSQGMLPIAGRANIRYPTDVSGAVDSDVAFRGIPKPPGWEQDLQMACELRRKSLAFGVNWLSQIADSRDAAQGALEPGTQLQAQMALAQMFAYQGKMAESIAQWEAALHTASKNSPEMLPQLQESLGIAYFHKSEMENEAYRTPGDRCLFPPQHPVSYRTTADSQKTIEFLLQYLTGKPNDLEVKWLLNLAYMTLGKYPAGVPQKYLISPSAFESKEAVGRFHDVAPAVGLDSFSMAGGVIVDDFENHGLLDVVTSSYDMCEPLHYFHNNGDGTFTERGKEAGLADQLGGLNLLQADYNNDGCMDILVLRGAWQFPMQPSLLKNNCDGTFTDVTQHSGLADRIAGTQTAAWADIDNDGWIDLFIGNEQGPAMLYRNKGDGTFEDISHSAGIDTSSINKGVVAADYDNDGYVDFYVSNIAGNNLLYHNNHDRTFTEVGKQAGVQEPWTSFAAWFFDYDNDGWPDLFVTSYYISVDESIRSYLRMPRNAETLKLYRNKGDGTFEDVTARTGLDRVFMPMGANFGDIDNDGFLDIYLATGNPTYGSLVPNVLLRNKEGKSFVDVTASSGTGELHKGHGVAFADIDRDGDEDLFAETGGATPGDAHAFRLFENPGNGNDWINLKLVGVKTNRAAIGARIKVTVENQGHGQRSIYRTVGSGGSFGASPLEQHIGLGKSARITEIGVWWPVSNTRQVFSNVGKNQFLEIKELAKDYTVLERKSFHLGGARQDTPRSPNP